MRDSHRMSRGRRPRRTGGNPHLALIRSGVNLRPTTERSAASAKWIGEHGPKAPVALGSDITGKNWEPMTNRYTQALSLPLEERAGLKQAAAKPRSKIRRVFKRLSGSLKTLRNRVKMWSFRSKDRKRGKKLDREIDDAVKAAKSAELTAEQTMDEVNKLYYHPLGTVVDTTKAEAFRKGRQSSESKYLRPQGAENTERVFTPFYNKLVPGYK